MAALAGSAQAHDSLNGTWQFRLDPEKRGELQGWHLAGNITTGWADVTVPHTWQVAPETAAYLGTAWYRKAFEASESWAGQTVRVEFEAVYHSATVWVNGKPVGRHTGKGYTAFQVDVTSALRPGANVIAVQVENAPDANMLPRSLSYDWTTDGGLTRPVNFLVTPPVYIERVDVDPVPDLPMRQARLEVTLVLRNAGRAPVDVVPCYEVADDASGDVVLRERRRTPVTLAPGATSEVKMAATLAAPKLWHFDDPNLYRLTASIEGHDYATTFGVRTVEVREGGFYLNGERVWLMGVERMAGSHPQFGMAEPASWIEHDHDDMKELNCVFTRVHWQQDRRVLDYCDRNGILIQEEVPTWGPGTFKDMGEMPDPAVMDNGLEQLREMVRRDRNHPSIFAWGLCNEVNGQNPAAQMFARRMYEEAQRLDPRRLRTYASNSLQKTPDRDVAGAMDFVSWNEYYESWFGGGVADLERNLDEIHRAFPDKMIVISEYGYCECSPKLTGGDPRRAEIMRQHDRVFRARPWVGGAIFFCYNDYRTHMGDKGEGILKQRVHGVVDLYGARKPSFEVLRHEASPIAEVAARRVEGQVEVTVRTRKLLPAYTLRGYTVRCTVYSHGNLPMEQREAPLPVLAPGAEATVRVALRDKKAERVRVEIMRPTGFSAASAAI